jgi:hypothetical protein
MLDNQLPAGTNTIGAVKLTDGTLVAGVKALSTQVTTSDNAVITNSVIHGLSSAGGGGYVDVKVTPSGSLVADVSGSSGVGVTGTFWPTTQPVSNAGTFAVQNTSAIPAGTNAIGYITSPSTFTAGQQVITASAAALPSATLTTGIVLTNNSTSTVYLGGSSVTSSTGYALPSGASIGLVVSNLNVVYIIGTASSGSLSYIGS